ncbi:MAG: signal peptidase II, partial [Actinobacteria bacterium]|nr:signal peptidase II [Actinomycetota bacterium]
PKITSTAWAVVFGAILGGAFGNLLDRIFRAPARLEGHVVDFIELPNYPIFNLADSAIFCAAIAAIVLTVRAVPINEPKAD